jgi:hypothetical protein
VGWGGVDLTRYCSEGSQGVPLLLMIRAAGDKVKSWEVGKVR